MRQILLDTETTGLEPEQGHRIIEIGCVELIDRQFTGKTYHQYINPQRTIETQAIAVHNITGDFLADKPKFEDILQDFLEFITGAELIAHNASFDVGFINHEIKLISTDTKLLESYATVVDTLVIARKMFPGQRNTLDALCKRYKIDLTTRKSQGHGALLDAQLLGEVYLSMTCGQSSLFTDTEFNLSTPTLNTTQKTQNKKSALKVIYSNQQENTAHNNFLEMMEKDYGTSLWKNN